jgi:SAM-dependent methyltransferase
MAELGSEGEMRKAIVEEFGEQNRIHRRALDELNSDSISNPNLHSLLSHFGSLVTGGDIHGRVLADLGCGSGRFSKVLLESEPKLVHCVEPSSSFIDAETNLKSSIEAGIVVMHREMVESVELSDIDFAFMVGVLHHLVDPTLALLNVHRMLRPGGSLLVWVYGSEQSRVITSAIRHLRRFLGKLPDRLLMAVSSFFVAILNFYSQVVKLLPKKTPLKNYFGGRWRTYSFSNKKLIIFDQLNPSVAMFYTVEDLRRSLTEVGFKSIVINVLEGSFGLAARCERGIKISKSNSV